MKIPAIITQGDSVTWQDASAADNLGNPITAPSWSLTWYIAGESTLNVTSTQSGTGWQTSLSAAQTAALKAGEYYWQALAVNGSQRVTLGTGRLTIAPSIATATAGFDGRSQTEQDLAAVQAAIRARISGGAVAEYTIGSRRLRNEPMSELLALESRLKGMVANESRAQSIANGLGDPRNVYVRFG